MFDDKEISLMRSLGLDCDFNNLSDDDDYRRESRSTFNIGMFG